MKATNYVVYLITDASTTSAIEQEWGFLIIATRGGVAQRGRGYTTQAEAEDAAKSAI